MIRSIASALIAVIVFAASAAVAEVPRTITWDDLLPPEQPLDDPFPELTQDQRLDLQAIASLRQQKAQGLISAVSPAYELAVERMHKLESQGLDVDALLNRLDGYLAKAAEQDEEVVPALQGQLVRMPGYALPLEFAGTAVKEFLLVPYVGACIHVPPPPPNQMVFVRLAQPFQAADVYTPVWITGRMTIERTTSSLSLVDGQNDVSAGYVLDGVKVEPYRE